MAAEWAGPRQLFRQKGDTGTGNTSDNTLLRDRLFETMLETRRSQIVQQTMGAEGEANGRRGETHRNVRAGNLLVLGPAGVATDTSES